MQGSEGFAVVKLAKPIHVEQFVLSYIDHRLTPDYSAAPRLLSVYVCFDQHF